MLKEEFDKEFLNGEYIRKLNDFIDKYGNFDRSIKDINMKEEELKIINMLPYLYEKIDNYFDLKGIYIEDDIFFMNYKEYIYKIMCDGNNYLCVRYKNYEYDLNVFAITVDYKDLNNTIVKNNLNLTLLNSFDSDYKSCLNCTNSICDNIGDDDDEYCILWQNNKVKSLKKEGII